MHGHPWQATSRIGNAHPLLPPSLYPGEKNAPFSGCDRAGARGHSGGVRSTPPHPHGTRRILPSIVTFTGWGRDPDDPVYLRPDRLLDLLEVGHPEGIGIRSRRLIRVCRDYPCGTFRDISRRPVEDEVDPRVRPAVAVRLRDEHRLFARILEERIGERMRVAAQNHVDIGVEAGNDLCNPPAHRGRRNGMMTMSPRMQNPRTTCRTTAIRSCGEPEVMVPGFYPGKR